MGNRRILVTEDDVTRVYGFPKGKRFVRRFQKKDESQLFDEMMDYIPETQRHKITIKKLHEAALSCIDGGAWFKRHFIVAIQATFMESTANGYVSPFILNYLSDVNRIKEWNWSEYVMRSLIENKTAYAEENGSHFVGPLLFLMGVDYLTIPKTNKVAAPAAKAGARGNIEGRTVDQVGRNALLQSWANTNVESSPNEDFGIGGSSAGKNMQDGKDDGARNVIVDVRTNTPTHAVAAENVVANKNVDLRDASDTTAGFTNAGAEKTAKETIRRYNTPARTKANYRASRLPQSATEVAQPQILPADTITDIKKRRAKNVLNKPFAFRSPFLHSPNTEETIVFANIEVEITRDHMYTLAKNQKVGVGVVDAWCLMLNHLENSCSDALVAKYLTQEERKDSSFENITSELNSNKHLELREIEINKYFAVCICLRTSKIVVLDTVNDDAIECHAPKYGDLLPNLRAIQAEYLFYRGLVTKAKLLEKSTLEISAIKWGDRHNLIDSGVYLMRRIETFMGDISTKWICGLSGKCDKQLVLLRIRYCVALINWPNNLVKDSILENADTHYRKVCADPDFKPETLLLGYFLLFILL
ncbi:hypothetical protein OROMI_006285 [Orobanche minor]